LGKEKREGGGAAWRLGNGYHTHAHDGGGGGDAGRSMAGSMYCEEGGGVGTHKGGGGGGGGSEEWRVTGGTEGRPGESTGKEKEGGRHRSNAGGGDIPQIRP
jgi:hypothetical protein